MATPRKAGTTAAKDPTSSFFNELAARGHEPLLQGATGSIRFDLANGPTDQHWHVIVRKGDVTVSQRKARADAVVRLDKALCDRLATGRANAMAAMLRGLINADGDLGLVMQFQRLFPGPPRSGGATP